MEIEKEPKGEKSVTIWKGTASKGRQQNRYATYAPKIFVWRQKNSSEGKLAFPFPFVNSDFDEIFSHTKPSRLEKLNSYVKGKKASHKSLSALYPSSSGF